MISNILEVKSYYSKFGGLLVEDIQEEVPIELSEAKDKILREVEKDEKMIQKLINNSSKTYNLSKLKDPDYIIKKAFQNEGEEGEEYLVIFHYSHWIMSKDVLVKLLDYIISLYKNLVTYYKEYGNSEDKKTKIYNHIRSYQDFFGGINSIIHTIDQYYDNFVLLCKKIDSSIKEKNLYASKADIRPRDFYKASLELLLHGNRGRLCGFPLLRSAIEIHIYEKLFEMNEKSKYDVTKVLNWMKILNNILRIVDDKKLGNFQTDSLRRLYDWQSLVIHHGYRTDDYILWYSYFYFDRLEKNFERIGDYRDVILEELLKKGLIEMSLK